MNIAKYVLESIAANITSILINGYNLSVNEAYICITESNLLYELEESPYRIMSIDYNDCLTYADKLYNNYVKVKDLKN